VCGVANKKAGKKISPSESNKSSNYRVRGGQSGVDWRSLYLYAICLITLLIILFSTIAILNGVVNLALPDPAYVDPYAGKESLPNPELLAQQQEYERLRVLKRILTSLITMVITIPIYLYHWRQAKKD
jgi:hypothetical protein